MVPPNPASPEPSQAAGLELRAAGSGIGSHAGAGVSRGLSTTEFDGLYRTLWSPVVNYLRFRVGPADAADLASEVFVRGWVARTTYDPLRGVPANWIWAIARNLATDRARRPPVATEPLAVTLADDLDVAVNQARAEDIERMLAAVARLAPEDREVVALRFGAGVPHKDIGAMLGLEPGTVAVRLHRALGKLRTTLGEDQP